MKKTYHVSNISRKIQTIRVWSRILIGFDVNDDEVAFWTSPEGIRCQQAERLWLNLADSEMPVSGRVVTRLVDILDRAFAGACERGYARRSIPDELRRPVWMIPRAQYVLWKDVSPTYKGTGLIFGIRRG